MADAKVNLREFLSMKGDLNKIQNIFDNSRTAKDYKDDIEKEFGKDKNGKRVSASFLGPIKNCITNGSITEKTKNDFIEVMNNLEDLKRYTKGDVFVCSDYVFDIYKRCSGTEAFEQILNGAERLRVLQKVNTKEARFRTHSDESERTIINEEEAVDYIRVFSESEDNESQGDSQEMIVVKNNMQNSIVGNIVANNNGNDRKDEFNETVFNLKQEPLDDKARQLVSMTSSELEGPIVSQVENEDGDAIRKSIEQLLGLDDGELKNHESTETLRLLKFHTKFTKAVSDKKRNKNISSTGLKSRYLSGVSRKGFTMISNAGMGDTQMDMTGIMTPRRLIAALAPALVSYLEDKNDLPILLGRGLSWSRLDVRMGFKEPVNLAFMVDGFSNGFDWSDNKIYPNADPSFAFGITFFEFYNAGIKNNLQESESINSAHKSAERKIKKFLNQRKEFKLNIENSLKGISLIQVNSTIERSLILELVEGIKRLGKKQSRLL